MFHHSKASSGTVILQNITPIREGDNIFFYGKGNENQSLGTCFLMHDRIVSAVKKAEFFCDRMSHIVLRGRYCNTIVLNVHAPNKEISDDSKDIFYDELEQVFYHFPKYHTKILLGDFNIKLGDRGYFQKNSWE
jgi:hypothetical protein